MSGDGAGGQLALYTTVYPEAACFLADWFTSVQEQTDQGFELWIGSHGLDRNAAEEAMGGKPRATWLFAVGGDSGIRLRERAMERMAAKYAAVVFVDCDDVLEPGRVADAREMVVNSDIAACSMRLIDELGRDLGACFSPPAESSDPADLLVGRNVFGLSNTVYRSTTLRGCLPVPDGCELMDWFLATRAWAQGARLRWDPRCGMAYRQHRANTAQVLPPFDVDQLLKAARRVIGHYALVLTHVAELPPAGRRAIQDACRDAELFAGSLLASTGTAQAYVEALNALPAGHLWWETVAHPKLAAIWRN